MICCKIKVLRAATKATAHITAVGLADTMSMVQLMFVPVVFFTGFFLPLVIHVTPLIDPILNSGHFLAIGYWWVTFSRPSSHSLREMIHSL